MIIDIHSHLDRDTKTKEYKVDELLKDMEENNIDKRVVSTMFGSSVTDANNFIIEAIRKHPDRLIGCAVINPKLDDCIDEARRVCDIEEIKFIELDSLEHGYRPEKFDHNITPILEICNERNKIVKVFTGHGFWTMPDQWMYYFEHFPSLNVIFVHMGGSDFEYGTVDLIKENSRNNLYLDTSYETEIQALNRAFNELPKEVFLYGSNYPKNFTNLSILKLIDLGLDKKLLDHVFYKNAKKLLNIE